MRAIAALTVAIVHLGAGFAYFIDDRVRFFGETGAQLASTAVALFFMISGCVMVLSAGPMFGSARGVLTFWRRRAVRVLPPYWIATALLLGVSVVFGLPYTLSEVATSLALVPQPHPAGPWSFKVFLWPGWTLFYEMVFYALFGACVALGRIRAVVFSASVLTILAIAGSWVSLETLWLHALTRPILLLFVPGMLMGLMLLRGFALPGWARWICAAGSVALVVILGAPVPSEIYGFGYLLWAGLPALLLFVGALGGSLPFVATRPIVLLGDASYAIYLLHIPFAHAWIQVFNFWMRHPGGSIGYLVLGIPMLIVLSIAFYLWVERPMTTRLNRLLGRGGAPSAAPTKDHAP